MSMTLNEYITNPMQKAGRVYTASMRETQQKTYVSKYNNLVMREGGKFTVYKYYDKAKNQYYIHVKVPSEPLKRFYYDVVFKFYADAKIEDAGRDLGKYYVQFFSNDPNFVYTYAHVFLKADLFVKELSNKMSKIAIKNAAKVTNATNQVGYVKSIYFAYLYMKNHGLLDTAMWGDAKNYSKGALSFNVMHADEKVAKTTEETNKLKKLKKQVVDSDLEDDTTPVKNNIKTVGKVSTIKKTNTIRPTTRSKKNTK